jgi:uncharacterized protein (DUF433 family)
MNENRKTEHLRLRLTSRSRTGTTTMRSRPNPKRQPKAATQDPISVGEYLVVDPRVCHGELTFRGTRVPIATILSYLRKGYSQAYLRKSWPEVSAEAIEEAISLASEQLVERYRQKNS